MERFRRRNEDIRRLADHPGPFLARRVAAADGDTQRRQRNPHRPRPGQDPFERELEIAPDVLIERLERRHVEDPDALLFPRGLPEVVECRQEGRKRLARAGRCHDQSILPRGDQRPAQTLRRRGLAELLAKPRRHRLMERSQHVRFVSDGWLHVCKALSRSAIRVGHSSNSILPQGGPARKSFLYRSLPGGKMRSSREKPCWRSPGRSLIGNMKGPIPEDGSWPAISSAPRCDRFRGFSTSGRSRAYPTISSSRGSSRIGMTPHSRCWSSGMGRWSWRCAAGCSRTPTTRRMPSRRSSWSWCGRRGRSAPGCHWGAGSTGSPSTWRSRSIPRRYGAIASRSGRVRWRIRSRGTQP